MLRCQRTTLPVLARAGEPVRRYARIAAPTGRALQAWAANISQNRGSWQKRAQLPLRRAGMFVPGFCMREDIRSAQAAMKRVLPIPSVRYRKGCRQGRLSLRKPIFFVKYQ
jgi:hypothetical protein